MSTPEAKNWVITAAPAQPIAPHWHRRPSHFGAYQPVFAPAPDGWPASLPLPAAEASVSALYALSQLHPEGPESNGPPLDTFAIPSAPGPVPLPASEPSVRELILVVDTGLSMSAWYPTVNAFAACACELPLFSDVHIVKLRSQPSAAQTDLIDRAAVSSLGIGSPSPPHRQKTIFIITDAVGATWKRGLLWNDLRTWAQHHTVAILHVLPHYNWYLSGIHSQPTQLRAPVPGCANSALELAPSRTAPSDDESTVQETAGRILIPVLEIRKRWLDQWVRLMLSTLWVHQQTLEIPATTTAGPVPSPSLAGDHATSPEQSITEFRTAASENSFSLAVLLAAAPLNRHIMQLIAAELLPASDPGDLAALLTSGLLITVESSAEHNDPHDQVVFDFAPGVRQKLLSFGESGKTRRVAFLLDKYVGPHVPAIRGIAQRIKTPAAASAPAITPEALPYLRVECAVLTALSGDSAPHREAAESLRTKIAEYETHHAQSTAPKP